LDASLNQSNAKGDKLIAKFIVECLELVKFEIEADSEEQAERIAGEQIIEKCLNDVNSFDWSIYAVRIPQSHKEE